MAQRVRLLMNFEEATDPAEAVEMFIGQIVDFGLRGFLYLVEDTDTGEVVYVAEGDVLTDEEVEERFGPSSEDDEDDEETSGGSDTTA